MSPCLFTAHGVASRTTDILILVSRQTFLGHPQFIFHLEEKSREQNRTPNE